MCFGEQSGPVGNIPELSWVRSKLRGSDAIWPAERQVFTFAVQAEIRVQLSLRVGSIFARGKNNQESLTRNADIRKLPLLWIEWIIREMPPGKRHRRAVLVMDLDPIAVISILIANAGVVPRHELGNDYILRRQR
jgi:hypothetical protein